jgi:hypothetical protein
MKVTRKGSCGGGTRSFVFDSARLDLLGGSTPLFLNILIDADHRTIAHSWISLRRLDGYDLQKELARFFSEWRSKQIEEREIMRWPIRERNTLSPSFRESAASRDGAVDMSSTRSCNTSPYLKAHVERAFTRLEASLPVKRDRTDSCACETVAELWAAANAEVNRCGGQRLPPRMQIFIAHSSTRMIERADRSSQPAQHVNRHGKESGRPRSPQSSKKPRR